MREAALYEKRSDGIVVCNLCAHRCRVRPGRIAVCHVRENIDGVLHTLVDDRVVALAVDPIEKKPLFHYLPGTRSFSFATAGCNFRCRHCQNWTISQVLRSGNDRWIPGRRVEPKALVEQAVAAGCRSIAYTYTEPTIFFELARDVARIARAHGLKNVFVTNGYMTREALGEMSEWLDAANVDLKGWNDRWHRRTCGARLQPVLDSIVEMRRLGIWMEVTTLVIPGQNDSDDDLHGMARFLASVGTDIPWHLSAFYPSHQMLDVPPTDAATLERARKIGAQEGLEYIYCGNLPGQGHESTLCPRCREILVVRWGFEVRRLAIESGRCPSCGLQIPGLWEPLPATAGHAATRAAF